MISVHCPRPSLRLESSPEGSYIWSPALYFRDILGSWALMPPHLINCGASQALT